MKLTPLLLLLLGTTPGAAQTLSSPEPLIAGERRTVRGSADTELTVYLPSSYHGSQRRYPVLYVLDPQWNAEHAASTAHFLAATSRMPEVIVVGVSSSNRNRDFTPTRSPAAGGSGGAPAFLDHLAQEVFAAVDSVYRTEPMRGLVGHSLGGLFGAWAFVERPGLFRAVILLDPSMWWDDRAVAYDIVRRLPALETGRFVVVESGGPGGWAPDTADLRNATGQRVQYSWLAQAPGENHQSMPLTGLYHGLRAAFADYVPDMRGDTEAATAGALEEQYAQRLSTAYGYPVAPPLAAIEEVVQRTLNRHDGADALRAADLAVRFYPDSDAARTVLANAKERAAGLTPIPPPPPSSEVTAETARLFAGKWLGVKDVEGGQSVDMTLTLEPRGSQWMAIAVSHGISNEGGDLRSTLPAVLTQGSSIELWFHNCCGGYLVTKATLQADGSLRGVEQPRHIPIPAGMTLPEQKVTVHFTRAH